MKSIEVTRSSMPPFDEYVEEIRELWESHWLTNSGKLHNCLQEKLQEYLQVESINLFCNGHLALENVLGAFEFPKGSEVITSPFTFASTTNAIVRNGLKPVFCDIREDDCTIDASQIEEKITSKTVAILPIHVYGNICDTEAIQRIATSYGLKVIYDAAHAFGVCVNGRSVAGIGDASMFSFHATKVFNTIEGGCVTNCGGELTRKIKCITNFGLNGENCGFAGGNAKMNEFSAAMGICNLRHLDEEIAKRKQVYDMYHEKLDGKLQAMRIFTVQNSVTRANYAYFPVMIENGSVSRNELITHLADVGIHARKYFYPLTSSFEYFNNAYSMQDTPVALKATNNVLALPMYADLSEGDIERVCKVLLSLFGR